VAYGHYPLEVIGHGETNPWWPWGVVKPQHKGLAPSLRQVLMDHNTSAYLNGHLHSAFGNKLHRMHRNGATGELLVWEPLLPTPSNPPPTHTQSCWMGPVTQLNVIFVMKH
jgi:hypothetical protein